MTFTIFTDGIVTNKREAQERSILVTNLGIHVITLHYFQLASSNEQFKILGTEREGSNPSSRNDLRLGEM